MIIVRKEVKMDTILLDYLLKKHDISNTALIEAMGWSEGTRQTRCIRGENWRMDEVKTLLKLGISWDDLGHIFLIKNYQI